MKVKTAELTGTALDWAAAKACFDDTLMVYFDEATGAPLHREDMEPPRFTPSTDWSQGGPIIEREKIDIEHDPANKEWSACWFGTDEYCGATGPTPLIAAMRCFVASRLGDEADIPEELL